MVYKTDMLTEGSQRACYVAAMCPMFNFSALSASIC